MNRLVRILSTALITAGFVLLADVGLTVVWEEPVSSVYGSIQQDRAQGELDDLETSFKEAEPPKVARLPEPKGARELAAAFEERVESGKAIGRIVIPQLGVDAVMVQGTTTSTLRKGPGHYPQTGFPGQGTTIGVAGHRTTYLAPFRDVNELERGDEIGLEMPYGDFTYEVERTEIAEPTEVDVLRDAGRERLVLTTCYPLYSAAQRYVVFGRLADVELASP